MHCHSISSSTEMESAMLWEEMLWRLKSPNLDKPSLMCITWLPTNQKSPWSSWTREFISASSWLMRLEEYSTHHLGALLTNTLWRETIRTPTTISSWCHRRLLRDVCYQHTSMCVIMIHLCWSQLLKSLPLLCVTTTTTGLDLSRCLHPACMLTR